MTLKHPLKQSMPFLGRNHRLGVNAPLVTDLGHTMDTRLSTLEDPTASSVDEEAQRPTKRRRVSSTDSSMSFDHLIASSPNQSEVRSTLRIEVSKLIHRDSKKIRISQPAEPSDVPITCKASCRVTISDTSDDGGSRVLHCQSQICTITTTENQIGPQQISKVDLPKPFFVPEESLFVNRSDNGEFDLPDSYSIMVELETAGGQTWPPLEPKDLGLSENPFSSCWKSCRHLVLFSTFQKDFGRDRPVLQVKHGRRADLSPLDTAYVMAVNLCWTGGFKVFKRLDKGYRPCIEAMDTQGKSPDATIVLNSPEKQDAPLPSTPARLSRELDHKDSGEKDEIATPTRHLRSREDKNYNLKLLTAKAHGKRDGHFARARNAISNDSGVSYLLPPDQPIRLASPSCYICGSDNETMADLLTHIQKVHPSINVVVEREDKSPMIRLKWPTTTGDSPFRAFSDSQARPLFTLNSATPTRSSPLKAHESPYEAPAPSPTPQSRIVIDRAGPASPSPIIASVKRKEQLDAIISQLRVPETNEPLYHPVSKAILLPGDPVPVVGSEIAWLLQKHRQSIDEFEDIAASEREFIQEWDEYILQQDLTSSGYLPRTWVAFVQVKADWLAAAPRRVIELGKHMCAYLLRNLLTAEAIKECISIIDGARKRAASSGKLTGHSIPETPPKHAIRRSTNGCAMCDLPVLGLSLLICRNKVGITITQLICVTPNINFQGSK